MERNISRKETNILYKPIIAENTIINFGEIFLFTE